MRTDRGNERIADERETSVEGGAHHPMVRDLMALAIGSSRREETMRIFHSLGIAVAASLLVAGCANLYSLDDYTTARRGPDGVSSDIDEGAPSTGEKDGVDGGTQANACRSHADCGGDGSSVCVRATGVCASLTTAECPRVYGEPVREDAVLVGVLLRSEGDASSEALEKAAVLAAEEIGAAASSAGLPPLAPGEPSRPIVVVACDESGDVIRAARHLVDDLHVAAIVGPTAGEHVVEVTRQVTVKGDTMSMTPTSSVSSLAQLGDDGLTFRNVPSDAQLAKLIIGQMTDLEGVLHATRSLTSVKLAVPHRGDAMGTSARDAIAGKLILNGRFIGDAANAAFVSVDVYGQAGDRAALGALAARYAEAFVPDIVFVTAPEQINGIVVPLEQALTAARASYRPYYVCTAEAKTQALLDAIASPRLPPDLRRRVRGVGTRPDTTSAPVLAAYQSAFAERYGSAVGSLAAAPAYDAMYAVAFAIAAAGDAGTSGAATARGLRALGVGNAYSVGPAHAGPVGQALAAGRSVSLRGTTALMQWDANGDVAGGTVEVWCVGASSGAPAFGSSGLTMDVGTQVTGGAFVQCQ